MDYRLLPVDDEIESTGKQHARLQTQNVNNKLPWAAIAVSVACLAFNLLTVFWTVNSSSSTFPSTTSFLTTQGMTRKDIDKLRRPSQFIGFDNIPRNATSPAPVTSFVNFPMLMAHIDSVQPYKVTRPRKGVFTSIGTIYPELSDMIVSPLVSTIVQFRALDYGMERCELSITIPISGNAYPLVVSPDPIEIYALASKTPLYGDSLSYKNRPRRDALIGTPSLVHNSTWSHTFSCSMDEIYTFEVACATPKCSVKWTQDKEHRSSSSPAILMTQFSTV